MIMILSDRNDLPTYRVAKNLEHLGNTVMILTDEDEVTEINISGGDARKLLNLFELVITSFSKSSNEIIVDKE